MRKEYPGKGVVKIRIDIVTLTLGKRKIISVWNIMLNVNQARDFILKGCGRRIGKNSLYFIKEHQWYQIPTSYKFSILPADVIKNRYSLVNRKHFFILVSPNGTLPDFNTNPRATKLKDHKPIPIGRTLTLDADARQDLGLPSGSDGTGESSQTRPDQEPEDPHGQLA